MPAGKLQRRLGTFKRVTDYLIRQITSIIHPKSPHNLLLAGLFRLFDSLIFSCFFQNFPAYFHHLSLLLNQPIDHLQLCLLRFSTI